VSDDATYDDRAGDPSRCTLCGDANECGVARGDATCWCFSLTIPESVKADLQVALAPRIDANASCVCAACIERAKGRPTALPEARDAR